MKKINCGVIGVGYLGAHHARIYSEMETVQLVGVVDSNPERAEEICKLREKVYNVNERDYR